MSRICVLIEQKENVIQDISYEMLTHAAKLAAVKKGTVDGILLGGENIDALAVSLKEWADRIIFTSDVQLQNFNGALVQQCLENYLAEEKPDITLIAHSAFGLDVAPSIAASLDMPLISDCFDITAGDRGLKGRRQMYGGKVNTVVSVNKEGPAILTVRSASFQPESPGKNAETVSRPVPCGFGTDLKRFIEYVEAAAGDVDITQAEIVIGVGRGIKDAENMPLLEKFAESIGGVLACSRPVVDAGWLPKDRQVGSSGKTIKPKLYIALGISGAFQHVAGLKGADTVVAVNKDPNAPIFGVADFGIVDDLLKVVPLLTDKLQK